MYKYEIWFEGNCLHKDDYEYEEYNEAEEEAIECVNWIISEWKANDAYNGETVDDFDIRIEEE